MKQRSETKNLIGQTIGITGTRNVIPFGRTKNVVRSNTARNSIYVLAVFFCLSEILHAHNYVAYYSPSIVPSLSVIAASTRKAGNTSLGNYGSINTTQLIYLIKFHLQPDQVIMGIIFLLN